MPATRHRDRLGQQRQRAQTMERKSSIMLAGHMQYNAMSTDNRRRIKQRQSYTLGTK